MKLAIGYSSKDQVKLTRRTLKALTGADRGCTARPPFDLFWCDGSITEEGRDFPSEMLHCFAPGHEVKFSANVRGGPDAAIAWKISTMLASPERYTHIMLLENDVLLDEDWFEPTMALFDKGAKDGLNVGAVSPRSYVDRVLIQRDGYAVMHNIGAGAIVFTRDAAEMVLHTFRTGWWMDNVKLFAHLSGIDLRTYACFRGNEQWVTTDWQFEAQIARHGLASLALTPAKCRMIGQNPPLEQQGLELVGSTFVAKNEQAFEMYRAKLARLGVGAKPAMLSDGWAVLHREGTGILVFPHQIGNLVGSAWQGNLELKATQGFGPFSYRAGPGGASLSLHVSSSCSFLVSGGAAGASVTIEDHRSGFKASPSLPADQGRMITVTVPGGPVPRRITMQMEEGAVFYGLSCSEPQLIDTTWKFNWAQLPEAK